METVESKVSGPVKMFALVAILAGLAGVGAMTFLGPSADSAAATALGGVQLDSQGRVIAVAKKANERIAAPNSALNPSRAADKKARAAKSSATKPRKPVAPNGLPRVVADALMSHSAVVVALYTPQGKIDPIGFVEAKQGAALARAGFVAINVFDSRTAAPLMTKLGVVLRAPAVLVFKRPGDLVTRIDGFADRETVAQAAQNAAP